MAHREEAVKLIFSFPNLEDINIGANSILYLDLNNQRVNVCRYLVCVTVTTFIACVVIL